MENVSDKLKLLDCEKKFCQVRDQPSLQRWCFAMPGRNPSIQFALFLDLCSWLLQQVTDDGNFFKVDKFDDPNTSVNKLMLALRKLDFGLDFAAARLKQAHGEAPVGVLDFLTDKACEKSFTRTRPEYSGEQEEELAADEDADVGGIEDDIEAVEEEEAMFKELVATSPEQDPGYKSQHEILKSKIDPIAWQTELERVGPRLRIAQRGTSGKEWRAHVDLTKASEVKLCEVMPVAQKQLEALAERTTRAQNKIGLKENYINKQFETKKEAYATLKQALDAVAKAYEESSDHVSKLTTELAGIADQLDEMKGTMADRGNSMTDTSPLVQIKQALKQIKLEVVAFDLQIGVVGHTLMQQKLRRGSPNAKNQDFKNCGNAPDTMDLEDSDMDSLGRSA